MIMHKMQGSWQHVNTLIVMSTSESKCYLSYEQDLMFIQQALNSLKTNSGHNTLPNWHKSVITKWFTDLQGCDQWCGNSADKTPSTRLSLHLPSCSQISALTAWQNRQYISFTTANHNTCDTAVSWSLVRTSDCNQEVIGSSVDSATWLNDSRQVVHTCASIIKAL